MNIKKITTTLLIITASLLPAQQVLKFNKLSGGLKQQFENAFEHLKSNDNFWIAYSILRTGNHNIMYGTFFSDDNRSGINLRDILSQRDAGFINNSHKVKKNIRRGFHFGHSVNINDKPSDKETAILFRYDKNSSGIGDFKDIDICSLSRYVDLYGLPVAWLGKQDSQKSVEFLFALYRNSGELRIKKDLAVAIGIHSDIPRVTNFLINIINSNENPGLRKSVAFWLGLQDNEKALEALKKAVNYDPSDEVRKNAVWGIGYINMPGAIDELVNVARHNSERELRKDAVYALGNKAVKKAEKALKDFVENDPDIEVKKSAVYALANSSTDNIPFLIKIARSNPNLEIRKTAIYSLGNSDDERALDALIELARN